jgi:arabinose-5-phosphate isomerase
MTDIAHAKQVFNIEIESLKLVESLLDESFTRAVAIIQARSQGRVIVTGMGKSGHIGAKIAATLASTGTSAFFVHPAEMGHGDLGMVHPEDIVLALSYSGNTLELSKVLLPLKRQQNKIIAITGNLDSELARHSDVVLHAPISKEACPLELAPTSSTTVALVLGDALAIALMHRSNFQKHDFAKSHPLGSLGQSMLKVSELMREFEIPQVSPNTSFQDLLKEINLKNLGFAAVLAPDKKLLGIVTDGDLRRAILKHANALFKMQAAEVMTSKPITIKSDDSALLAADFIKRRRIGQILVVDDNNLCLGVLDLKDLLTAGFKVD